MESRVIKEAPAKINLWLRVLGKRDDGFHALETRMLPLGLADRLEVGIDPDGGGIRLNCLGADLPEGRGNLAYAAAEAFLLANELSLGIDITLEKRIPAGAGLGGGSSDAAAVLLALDELCETGMGASGLAPIAAGLGSDIPFFLYGKPCDCSGRGELVVPSDDPLPQREVLLVKPDFPISTPWAYGAWADSQEIPGVPYAAQSSPWGEIVNHLERPVFAKYLLLADTKEWLLAQPEVDFALMSGSGSTSFAILKEAAGMTELEARARDYFGEYAWLCATNFALESTKIASD